MDMLPKQLQNIIVSLLNENMLASWRVTGICNSTTVSIRFDGNTDQPHASMCTQQAYRHVT